MEGTMEHMLALSGIYIYTWLIKKQASMAMLHCVEVDVTRW